MHRIVYTSTSTRLMSEARLEQILAVSRRNNARDGITGMLVYHEGCFLQVLEGPGEAVKGCYRRINRDPRHHGTIQMLNEATTGRIFSDWRMAYRAFDDLPSLQKRQFQDIRHLAESASIGDLVGHAGVSAILTAFLSSFRDLDVDLDLAG